MKIIIVIIYAGPEKLYKGRVLLYQFRPLGPRLALQFRYSTSRCVLKRLINKNDHQRQLYLLCNKMLLPQSYKFRAKKAIIKLCTQIKHRSYTTFFYCEISIFLLLHLTVKHAAFTFQLLFIFLHKVFDSVFFINSPAL